jgi:C-terminal processing protease CtpA/Prc
MLRKRLLGLLVLTTLLMAALPIVAMSEDRPIADIVNDEGGVVRVTGILPITNSNVKLASDEPLIILEDQSGFITRDFFLPIDPISQVQGRFTTDFYAEGNVEYEVMLPLLPRGVFHNFNVADEASQGIQVFQVAYWDNNYGDIYLDDREAYGWSGAYSSVTTSINPETLGEITGGKLLVYAEQEGQVMSSGFGEDGLLFTEDDPLVAIPVGFTMVDMDAAPFTFDRSREVVMDLREPDSIALDDFSEMSYTEAFDALIEKAKNEYVFTEFKGIDWDALAAEYRPLFEAADANQDAEAYFLAIDAFAQSIPDGHISAASEVSNAFEQEQIAGGLGFSVRELSDGRVLVIFLLEGSAAETAGIAFGTEITSINGVAIDEAITNAYSPNGPYSAPEIERLDKVRFVTRFPLSQGEVEVGFMNAAGEEETVTVPIEGERDSLRFTRQFVYGQSIAVPVPPVRWEFFPGSNYGYFQSNGFLGNIELIIKEWELFLATANAIGSPGIILDLRLNSGGFSSTGYRMTSYLIDEPIELPLDETYNADIDQIWRAPNQNNLLEPERDETKRYSGDVVALIGPGCASACEFFSYALDLADTTFVGVYGTNGIAGGWFDTAMPEGVTFALPTSRDVDAAGNIVIEGVGIQPDVRVEITEENMASTEDLALDAALVYLDSATSVEIVDGGALTLDTPIEGTIAPGQRVNYTFNTGEGGIVNFVIESEAGVYINILADDGETILADGTSPEDPGFEEVELPPDFDLVIQVLSDDDAAEGAFTISVVGQ